MRRTIVLMANNAKMASVAKRIRLSLNVIQAKIPRTTYAPSAIIKRFTSAPSHKTLGISPAAPSTALRARPYHTRPRLASEYGSTWCTGKDSNLRTSLGGTDLQSVGFNHSPTCAKTKKRGHTNQNPSKKRRRKLGNETRELPLDTCNQPENTLMECVKTGALSARLRANLPLFPETILWSWRRDLNPRPSDYKSDALPTELRQRLEARSIRRNTSPVPSERTGQLFKVPQR